MGRIESQESEGEEPDDVITIEVRANVMLLVWNKETNHVQFKTADTNSCLVGARQPTPFLFFFLNRIVKSVLGLR